jgi:hypothetical protein
VPDENDSGSHPAAQQPPICDRCGLRTLDLQASFVNRAIGKTVRIYKCQCGKLVWDPAHRAR